MGRKIWKRRLRATVRCLGAYVCLHIHIILKYKIYVKSKILIIAPSPPPPLFTHVHPLHSHSITKNCKQGTLDGSKQKWGQTREISDDNTPTWNQEFTKTNQASTYFESTSCLHFRVDDIDPGTNDNLFTLIEWTPNSASTWDAGTYGKFGSYGTVKTARTSDGQLLRYQLQIWASNCDAGYGNVDKTWYVSKCTHSQPDGVPRTH